MTPQKIADLLFMTMVTYKPDGERWRPLDERVSTYEYKTLSFRIVSVET
jgi:hypothetical protein